MPAARRRRRRGGAGSALRGGAGRARCSSARRRSSSSTRCPGVGPVTAQKILDYRQKHGAFQSVDELDAVPGIGPKRLEQLRELVVP